MFSSIVLGALSLAGIASSSALIQGDCTKGDKGLEWLSKEMTGKSAISCLGQPLQKYNSNRYWGTQFAKNASVVVFPSSTEDVSRAVKAANKSPLGQDFAFVGGAHSQVNASSAYGFILDLAWMNSSRVVRDFEYDGLKAVAIEYQGGANWGQVQTATNNSGYTAVGARVSNVGAGGFSLGGGIGFLAGSYGFATDRLLQLEVVLPSGEVVMATKRNKYADLFWALQGGSGQFGIVTTFWQEAVPEPKMSNLGYYYINDEDVERLRENTVQFFEKNQDPFSVVYYSYGYLPGSITNPDLKKCKKRHLLFTLHFNNPDDDSQLGYNETFADVFAGIDVSNGVLTSTPYYSDLCFIGGAAYPYGFRRGFYGPQVGKVDVKYLEDLTNVFSNYLDELISRGENPATASFVVQYMFPGLNGNLPKSDEDTAWPHAKVGHQTLFTDSYADARDGSLSQAFLEAFNQVSYRKQHQMGEFIADYPNYISPGWTGRRVYGDNMDRLMELKEKYDPKCLFSNGPVFGSPGCTRMGAANMFNN